jgi:hypothetical protein
VSNEIDDPTARPRLLRTTPMTLGRLAGLVLGGLALAATTIVAISSMTLLRDQAEEQALDRVRLAGLLRARRDPPHERGHADVRASARLATDAAAPRREGQSAPLQQFMQRFCETGGYDSCAVLAGPSSSRRPDRRCRGPASRR